MTLRRATLAVLVLLFASSCSRDPKVVSQKYVQNGNKYFDNGKFKEASIMYRNALKKDLRFGEAYYRLGLAELKLGHPQEAAKAFTRAVELQPNNADARIQLAELYLLAYTRGDARAEYLDNLELLSADLLQRDPKSAQGLRLSAYHVLLKDKNHKAAIAKFRAADAVKPNQPDIVFPLAQTLFADGQAAEGEKAALSLIETHKKYPPIYDLLYVYYLSAKRLVDAEKILQDKIRNNPGQGDFLVQLAAFYRGLQRVPDADAVLGRLSGDTAQYPDGKLKAGDFYFRMLDYERAIRHYREGTEADSARKQAYQNRIAQVLVAQGKNDEASKLVDDILRQSPKDTQAQGLRAYLMIESRDPDRVQKAITELQTMVGQTPANAPLRFSLARALWIKGDLTQTRIQLQEAIKHQPNYLPARLMLAEIRLQAREFPAAFQETTDILAQNPRNLQARLMQSRALVGLGKLSQARETLAAVLKDNPGSRDAQLQLAMLEMSENNFKSAEQMFASGHQKDAADLRFLFGLSEAYAAQNRIDRGIELLKTELAKNPGRQEIRSALANLEVRAGRLESAVSHFNALLKANPKSAELHMRLAETQRRSGDANAAIESFRKARDLNPSDPRPFVPLALLLESGGRKDEAKAAYQQALKLQPDNVVAMNNLAFMMAESGEDLDEALTLAQRARQRAPQDLNIADTLGWIYIRKNLNDNAIQIFRDLVKKAPDNSTFRYHLAMALFQRGDKPQAKKELAVALQNKPSQEEEIKIRELMDKLD
jgi:tetratricopeptide (TPR) repeat protein